MSLRMRLIDWVFGLLVLGIVVGLMLPSINTGIVMGPRAFCQNNLRHIVLALNHYEWIHGVYPPSYDVARGHGCFLFAMPELDQQEIFNAYNLALPNDSTADNGGGTSNAELGNTSLALLRCPASPFHESIPGAEVLRLGGGGSPDSVRFARSHYAVNWGGGRQGWGREFELAQGTFRGPMEPGGTLGSRDVTDGLGGTVLVAEKKHGFGWNVGGWAGSEFDVGTQPGDEGDDPIAGQVYTGSYHEGGLNVGFADGSVRFVRNRMNRQVWWAMITRNGQESINFYEALDLDQTSP